VRNPSCGCTAIEELLQGPARSAQLKESNP
jgi:hypothetical protein